MRASAPVDRAARVAESFGNAADAIGPVVSGCSVFAVTRGQWSMIDAVLHVLDQVGPSRVSLWTWTVAEYEVACLTRLRRDTRITGGRLVIDGSARGKNAGLISEWQGTFGASSVRYVENHAKMARVTSESGLRVLLRGSMNLNFNPRFEQFDLSEGGPAFDLVTAIEDSLPVLADSASKAETRAASQVGNAFPAETLALFGGVRRWAK